MNLLRKVLVGILNFPLSIVFLDVPPQMGLDYPIKNWRIFFSLQKPQKVGSVYFIVKTMLCANTKRKYRTAKKNYIALPFHPKV